MPSDRPEGFFGRTAVLLGAGASADAGLPMTRGITRLALDELALDSDQRMYRALLLVFGALVAHDSARAREPQDSVDIERLIAATRLLGERLELEISPFVGAWIPAVDIIERPVFRGSAGKKIGAMGSPHWESAFDRELKAAVLSWVGQGDGETYKRLANVLVGLLPKLVHLPDETRVDYLAPLLDARSKQRPVSIATLNYDLCIETAARRSGVPIDTGVERWIETGVISFQDGCIPLYKLHGSIDWKRTGGDPPGFHETLTLTERGDPWIVLGSREKLQASGPFLDLLSGWRASLLEVDHLVVIGYSFRDDHINDAIGGWLARDESRVLTVVEPHWPEYPDHRGIQFALIHHLQPNGIPGLPQVAKRFELHNLGAGQAIPGIFGQVP